MLFLNLSLKLIFESLEVLTITCTNVWFNLILLNLLLLWLNLVLKFLKFSFNLSKISIRVHFTLDCFGFWWVYFRLWLNLMLLLLNFRRGYITASFGVMSTFFKILFVNWLFNVFVGLSLNLLTHEARTVKLNCRINHRFMLLLMSLKVLTWNVKRWLLVFRLIFNIALQSVLLDFSRWRERVIRRNHHLLMVINDWFLISIAKRSSMWILRRRFLSSST